MDKEIILSVVVPVYNVEKYVENCLQSFVDNYKAGIEIIIVNDGSKDGSVDICQKYVDKYDYMTLVHKENGGLSSARNVGIKNCNGKYIWFVDSDDYITPHAFEKILNASKEDKDLILATYRSFYDETYLNDVVLADSSEKLPFKYFQHYGSGSYTAYSFIAKRNLILQNNLFFTEGIYHEDEDWSPQVLISAKDYTITKGAIYNYRIGNPNSIMGMLNPKKVTDKILIAKKMYDQIRNQNIKGDKKSFLEFRLEEVFIVAINEVGKYSGSERDMLVNEIKKHMYLLDNLDTKKAKLVKSTVKYMGVINTSKVLQLRNNILDKKNA